MGIAYWATLTGAETIMISQPLTQLLIGQQGQITEITSKGEKRLASLSGFGLVPGSVVTLLQRRLAYLIRVGETEIALEGNIAAEILVTVMEPQGDIPV